RERAEHVHHQRPRGKARSGEPRHQGGEAVAQERSHGAEERHRERGRHGAGLLNGFNADSHAGPNASARGCASEGRRLGAARATPCIGRRKNMKTKRYLLGLTIIVALGGGRAWADRGLGDLSFVGTIVEDGRSGGDSEVLRFRDGRLASSACAKYGFGAAPYHLRP